MYIGRLLLKGFKSFGDSYDLELSPGFTAIVGPNGSGKSNLLDALRWALGDTSLKRLRISSQKNLLFDGSASKQAAREAEVSLHLKDESRVCVIKRRVIAPDGATSLFVNNQRRTLTELDLIKRDWKLEGARFAFIGQGEVQAALEHTPTERRMQLEILFGIDVYRKKRTEASDRLITVKEEYDQLQNLVGELTSRRNEIAPAVKIAAAVKEIEDKTDGDRALLYHLRRANYERILVSITSNLNALEQAASNASKWNVFWKKSQKLIEEKIKDVANKQGNDKDELEQCRIRYDNLIKSGVSSAVNLRAASSRLKDADKEYQEAHSRFIELQREQKDVFEKNRKAREEVDRAERRLKAAEKRWEAYNASIIKNRQERENWNKERARLDGELQKSRSKLSYLGNELLDLINRKPADSFDSPLYNEQINELAAQREQITKQQEAIVEEHSKVFAQCQMLAGKLQNARREAANIRNRLNEASENLQSGMYPAPVRHLLSAAKLKRLNASPHAVIDVISADAKLAPALEAYLGGRQFQLLVEDMEEAGRCIDRLKQNAAGTAAFLPLERARPRYPNKMLRLPGHGIVGWAVELINIDEHWRPAIEHIIGDLLIVENYGVGKELVRSGAKYPIVTMEGDVFQPGGSVSGGKSQKSGRLLEMKAQIAALETSAKKAADISNELAKEYKAAEDKEIDLSEAKEVYTRKIRELNGKIAVIEDKKNVAFREHKRADGEKNRLLASMKNEGENWVSILNLIKELEEKRDKYSDASDDHKVIEEREQCRAAAAVASNKLSSLFAISERVRNELRAQENKIRSAEEEKEEFYSICIREKSNLARVGGSCLEIYLRRKELIAKLEHQGVQFGRLEKLKKYISIRSEKAEESFKNEREKLTSAESRKNELEHTLSDLTTNYEERYPYSGSKNLPQDVDIDELRKKIREQDKKIKAYGNVNKGVLSEDENIKNRLDFLNEQLSDVSDSMKEIERMITEADFMAYSQFTSALVKVDKRFCELFQILFGGGEAHLVMTEGDSIWHCGVEIDARLPGKHAKVLYQYSGGERTLISISMLFATMEIAGSPIAVLDEVDAALDEANLHRFSKLTKEYAQTRQILAMTHRRATMERADVLYGVTLEEKGLSKVVGVRIDDWS